MNIFLKNKKTRERAAFLLSFLLPLTILLSLFAVKGIYPFGDRSFLFSDMYHQYMPFFAEFMRKIKAGEGLAWSFQVGVGSNFLALYVYYLASPLHFFGLLVPEAYFIEFLSYLAVVKMALCGLTSFYYLKKHFQTENPAILFFSCFYALSGFMAAYNWNIMWLDCIILLPLIVLGLEKLVKEGKCALYCVTLALSIWTNYYISIMICIFLALYFVLLFLTEKRSFRTVGRFVLYSLLAAGMAAALLVPEVCAILETDFGDISFPEKLKSYFSVLDMLARHCVSVTTERGLEHWPNIYCGTAVFLLLPMYVLNSRISIRKRFLNLALAGFFLLSFGTNMLDFIWHGMNYPDSLPARQSFLYIFLVLILCCEAYLRVEEVSEKQILYGYLGAVVFLLFCEKFVDSEDFGVGVKVLTLIFVTIYAVLLYLYRTKRSIPWKCGLYLAALLAVIWESTMNMYDTSLGTTSRSAYLETQEDYKALYEFSKEKEDSIYRLEKFARKTKNDGTLAGYPTASVFSSTMNSHVMDLYEALGMRHSKVYYGFDGATLFTSALLNVNYMFGESEKFESDAYTLLQKSGDVYLYGCENTLPFGYVAPTGYDLPGKEEEDSLKYDGIQLQNRLVRELLGEERLSGRNLFTKTTSKTENGKLQITAKRTGNYYAVLKTSKIKKAEVIGGKLETYSYSDLKRDAILYLGFLQEGETVTLTNAGDGAEDVKLSAEVYVCDAEVLELALDDLSKTHLTEVTYDSRHVNGRIDMKESGRLILSIPKENGWKVFINGEKTIPEAFGGAFMAFDLEPGVYEITMHYTPEGSKAGVIISIVSICTFGVISYLKRQRSRKTEDHAAAARMAITQTATDQKTEDKAAAVLSGKAGSKVE